MARQALQSDPANKRLFSHPRMAADPRPLLGFGAAAGAELEAVLAGVEDASQLARVGALIIDCDSGADVLARARLR